MRIRNFTSTLNFAITTLDEDRDDDNVNFEKNFDAIMKQAATYIQKIVAKKSVDEELTSDVINGIILEDYDRLVNETYQNTDVLNFSMKYVAVKYLSRHRNEIPELLKEIDERGIVYSEYEIYTEDFHENLLIALVAVQNDYRQYCENMMQKNSEFLAEIEGLVAENGKIDGFKKYCDKYSKIKGIPYNARRQILSYGYLTIFGLEGLDEETIPENSAIMKYKTSNYIKDYINGYLERLEPAYRENLESAILSCFSQLEEFGEIESSVNKHNRKMKRIGLPGLGYSVGQTDRLFCGIDLPKTDDLMSKKALSSLDIDVLLRMNSCYNNRLAKVINDYSTALFVIDNLNLSRDIYEGRIPTRESMSDETLKQLMLKYKTLILPIKSFYTRTQHQIEENQEQFSENVEDIESENEFLGSKKLLLLDMDDFVEEMRKSWKTEYEDYFNGILPSVSNDLKQDILLTNMLYNPIFLSYKFKNLSLKSEYAYLYCLSQMQAKKSLNFGVVLKNDRDWEKRMILLASDGGVNLPNRSHTIKREYVDFLVAYTGKPLARIYEGFNDFNVGNEYIASKILLPTTKQHTKYLNQLTKGKLPENDRISKVTPENRKFIDHVNYCADSSKFMQAYSIPVNKVDKKGNVVVEYTQPIKYIDLTTGIIYLQKEDGRLVDKNGRCYGEEVQESRGRDE